ncbi:MAG: response regulator transcription factor [Mycobacteriaceae bacterium]
MNLAPRVLMVDDDADVRISVSRGLQLSGFTVSTAIDGRDALQQLAASPHDAVVLDLQMPELDGVAVVTALRALGNEIPICVLSARDTVNDRIAGLEAGADDYLIKPFDLGELTARLKALLRRNSTHRHKSGIRIIGDIHIDLAGKQVFASGKRVALTKREFELLVVLSDNIKIVVSRERLLELVWGYDFDVDTNVVDVFISYLRKKLEEHGSPRIIQTVRGVGFVLRIDP